MKTMLQRPDDSPLPGLARDPLAGQRQHDALEERIGDEQTEQQRRRKQQDHGEPPLVLELAQSRDGASSFSHARDCGHCHALPADLVAPNARYYTE